jgi:glycosyltransferase involved in cell wall biosynthesis
VTDLDMEDNIEWIGPVSQGELPQYLQNSDIFIHDGSTNSLDKVLLEAILCNCLVISSNPSYKDKVFLLTPDAIFEPKNSKRLAFIISKMALSEDRNKTEAMASLYSLVYANDSISKLVKKIVKSIS